MPISVIWFLLMMALWTRLSQARVWDKLTHKLQMLHPDEHLSFTEAVFQISEAIDDEMVLAPQHQGQIVQRLRTRLSLTLLPERRLRINRREIKQVYHKYKPKKRNVPPPEPFHPDERFEDFVRMEVRFPLPQEVALALK